MAFVVFQVFVTATSELASVDHNFNSRIVGLAWTSILVVLLAISASEVTRDRPLRRRLNDIAGAVSAANLQVRLFVLAGLLWLAVLALIGWLYPPSNTDSLVYHLTRVAHWVQNASVLHYPTHYLHQIELAPLHEYNLAHLHLLSGSDRLDGYVQLLASVVAIAGATEVARLLGGSRRAQCATAVLVATIPSFILEATSTQNNNFAAAIGIPLLILLIVWNPRTSPLMVALLLGLAVGAAVLSKGTLVAFFAPLCVLLLATSVLGESPAERSWAFLGRLCLSAATALAGVLLLAGPFLMRNVDIFGAPTGPSTQTTISSDLTPRAAAANIVRSTVSNFAVGDGRHGLRSEVSGLVLRSGKRIFDLFGVDPKDQRYALGSDLDAFKIADYTTWERSEDLGANPWHVCLIIAAGGILLVAAIRGKAEDRAPLLIAIGLTAGYLLFTATARWSIFAVRYYVPLLVAWCPIIALVLVRLRPWLSRTLLLLLCLACLPQLLDNSARSLLHPKWNFDSYLEPYFASAAVTLGADNVDFERMAKSVAEGSCDRLGIANWVLLEYPIWIGMAHERWSGRIEAVGVQNESRVLERRDFDACALLRQADKDYITPDDGLGNLRFGPLVLSMRPDFMVNVKANAPGFKSDVPGVTLRPGGGWVLHAEKPSLAGRGTIFVTSDSIRTLRLRLLGPSMELAVEQVDPSGKPPPVVITGNTDGTEVAVVVQPGTTRLVVSARGGSSGRPTLDFTRISVAPG